MATRWTWRGRGGGSTDEEQLPVHPIPAPGRQTRQEEGPVAIGHDILLASWYILTRDIDYQDLGGDYFDTHVMDPGRKVTRLTQQLQALGYRVTLEHAA